MGIEIYTDGAARGNPGASASGYVIYDPSGRQLAKNTIYNGIKTNNQAEYIAIIAALKEAGRLSGYKEDVDLFSDSELVINQLNGKYKVRNGSLILLYEEASSIIRKFKSCRLHNVPREEEHISMVDRSLNITLDSID